jgi:hypothetical protein
MRQFCVPKILNMVRTLNFEGMSCKFWVPWEIWTKERERGMEQGVRGKEEGGGDGETDRQGGGNVHHTMFRYDPATTVAEENQ